MSPERKRRRGAALRALLVGTVLGILAFAAGSLVIYEARGVLPASAGLVATLCVALTLGLWAGAPGAREGVSPVGRWLLSGVSLGAAGVFATAWTIRGWDRGGEPARALALLVLVGIPVYCIGLLLPTLARWESDRAGDEDADDKDEGFGAVGRVTAWAILGIAIGAVLAGIVLLPRLSPGPLLLGAGALLTFPLLFPRHQEEPETREQTLYERETPFSTLRVVEVVFPGRRQPELRLYQDEEAESGELTRTGAPTFAYIAAAERWLEAIGARGESYLFLGGGAYTLPRRVAERDPSARITVVELDPEVTDVAYRFFGLKPEHGIVTLHGDAREVAAGLPAGTFDRVFLDVYDGTETVPHHLVTREGMEALARLLRPGGTVGMNVIGVAAGAGSRRFWSVVRTAAEVFPSLAVHVHIARDYPERQNFLILGSADAAYAHPERAGGFDAWPAEEWPLAGTVVFRDRAGAAEAEAVEMPEPGRPVRAS